MLFGKRRRHVKRILIVEDEPLVAFYNEIMVSGAGYQVVATVDTVADALAVLDRELGGNNGNEERGVDLILTDVSLAGQRNGIDLAREAGKRGVPILFATAEPPEGADQLALGVLLKPYNERRLKAALRAVEQMLAGKARVAAPEGVLLYPPTRAAED